MNTSSYFIKDKALFGNYPSQEKIDILEKIGVKYFIDLTYPKEPRITPYRTNFTYINYPIHDKKIPKLWGSFAVFIRKISNIINTLENGDKLYLHCKGGHGRSGVVVSCILCYLNGCSPDEALYLTNYYHNQRPEMREKWRQLGSPQNRLQQEFVKAFFKPLYFYTTNKHSLILGLSNYSPHSVKIKDIGTFPTVESAYQAHKNLEDKEYVKRQLLAHTPAISKILGKKCKVSDKWDKEKEQVLKRLIKLKYEQHMSLKQYLVNTGLRQLIRKTYNTKGDNRIGEYLMELRNEYQETLFS